MSDINNCTCDNIDDDELIIVTAGIVVPVALLTIIIHIAIAGTYIGWFCWRKRRDSNSFDIINDSRTYSKGSRIGLLNDQPLDSTATLKALSNKLYDNSEQLDEEDDLHESHDDERDTSIQV